MSPRRQPVRRVEHRPRHGAEHPQLVLGRSEEARDHQLPHATSREGRPLLREDLRTPKGLGVRVRQVQACALQGDRLRALRRRSHQRQGTARPHGSIALSGAGRAHLVPARHAWWLAYLLMGTAPKESRGQRLEKVIYFAAHMVTFVDVDKRHGDLADLRRASRGIAEIAEREVEALDKRWEIEARAVKFESDGAKDPSSRPPARHREGTRRRAFAFRRGAGVGQAGLRHLRGAALASDHRRRSAVPRDGLSLRRVLRRRHGRRRHPAS